MFADVGLACGDQRRLTGNGSALEVVLHDDALDTNPRTFTIRKLEYCLLFTFCSDCGRNGHPASRDMWKRFRFSTPLYQLPRQTPHDAIGRAYA